MPQIPTHQPARIADNRLAPAAVSIPQAPPALRASADMFGGGEAAAALARASEAWATTAAMYQRAESETLYQNEKIGLRKKILEFEAGNPEKGVKGLVDRTDYQNFEPEFDALVKGVWKDYEERIQNQDVLQALKVELSTVALQKSAGVSKLARDKQADYGKGAYEGRQAEYLNLFAVSADPEERARILEDARRDIRATIAAGYIKPAQGVTDMGKFLERTSVVAAQEQIRKNPEQFNPDAFPFLSPEHRISLGDQASRRVEQNERERVRQEEKAERQAEKGLKEFRDNNARSLWVRVDKGLTITEVDNAISKRLVDLDEGKSLKKALGTDDGPEDEQVKTDLFIGVKEGSAGKREILSAYMNGHINRKTKDRYLEDYFARDKADALEKQPEYKEAEKHILTQLTTTGPRSEFDTDEGPRKMAALDDFKAQIGKGTPILEARDDVVKRFRVTEPGLTALPRPMFGTRKDPRAAFQATEQAYREGRIDMETYRREVLNLKRIQEALDRTNAERGTRSAEDTIKKVKARRD